MSTHAQKQKEERRQKFINRIMLIPVICLLAVVPLIVRMVYVTPKDARMYMLFNKTNLDDYYSQYKSVAIIVCTVVMIIMTYLFIQKSEVKLDKYSKVYLISGGILLLMTILSTILSDYKEIALWGVYDRAEGLVMWTCYLVMMFYTFYVVKDCIGAKWIIIAISFLVIVTTILGIFQYAGYDLLVKTKFGQALVIPKEYRSLSQNLTSDYESHKVLGTLFHYDYVGSFGAMIVPLFTVLFITVKDRKQKIVLGILTLASLFILFGSTSRAGLVGLMISIIIGVVMVGRKIIMNWKKTIIVSATLAIVLVGFNYITNGSIFSRIPTLVEDAAILFKPVEQSFDYKDYIPVREIREDNGEVIFALQQDELHITYQDKKLEMKDSEGNGIAYRVELSQYTTQNGEVMQTENYSTEDARFNNISIMRQNINVFTKQEPINAILVSINDSGFFYFELDNEGLHAIDNFSGETVHYEDASGLGFRGKEQIGSARGYIWSRALKLLCTKSLLVGKGPDTFVAYFPQSDVLGKWWAYGFTNIIIDKPHNLYLQIGVNQGGVALIAFLTLIGTYLIQCIKLYALKLEYHDLSSAIGIGIMLGIIGYLGAGFFNDSIISVAPIFWILLGFGMAINSMNQKTKNNN